MEDFRRRRSLELVAEADAVLAQPRHPDIIEAARRAEESYRQSRAQPEPEPKAPEPEPVTKDAVADLRRELFGQMERLAREIGRETANAERQFAQLTSALIGKLRAEIPDIMATTVPTLIAEQVTALRKEFASDRRREVAEVIRSKSNFEAFKLEVGQQLLAFERQVLELQREIAELRGK